MFIYIYSNCNSNEHITNIHKKFTNLISSSINLNDEYDVALDNTIIEPYIYTVKKNDE